MAGVRIGWLVTRDPEALQAIAAFKDYTTICSGAPGEVLALIGLRSRAALVERHRSRIVRNLVALEAFVARHDGRFALVPPRAGSVCLLRLREGHATDFCRSLVDKAGIMLLPSSVFQFGDEHVRVGLGRENLPDVLARLEGALAARDFRPSARVPAVCIIIEPQALPSELVLRHGRPTQSCPNARRHRTASVVRESGRRDQQGGLMNDRDIVNREREGPRGSLPRRRSAGASPGASSSSAPWSWDSRRPPSAPSPAPAARARPTTDTATLPPWTRPSRRRSSSSTGPTTSTRR